jgi:hypothetical protein
MNTPIIAASSSRTKIENSFTLRSTEPHDESSAIGVRNPVSTTSSRLMPSTPTE